MLKNCFAIVQSFQGGPTPVVTFTYLLALWGAKAYAVRAAWSPATRLHV